MRTALEVMAQMAAAARVTDADVGAVTGVMIVAGDRGNRLLNLIDFFFCVSFLSVYDVDGRR